jgi:putative flippase GtrA
MATLSNVHRFLKYSMVGTSTFALDLALLFFFTDVLGVYYVFSAGISFVIAVSINYWLAREHVFPETERTIEKGYIIFFVIAATGLLAVMGLMYMAVDIFGFGYIASRVVIAGFVGLWTYGMNSYVNFKVTNT